MKSRDRRNLRKIKLRDLIFQFKLIFDGESDDLVEISKF